MWKKNYRHFVCVCVFVHVKIHQAVSTFDDCVLISFGWFNLLATRFVFILYKMWLPCVTSIHFKPTETTIDPLTHTHNMTLCFFLLAYLIHNYNAMKAKRFNSFKIQSIEERQLYKLGFCRNSVQINLIQWSDTLNVSSHRAQYYWMNQRKTRWWRKKNTPLNLFLLSVVL